MKEKINWELLAITRFLLASVVMLQHIKEYAANGGQEWFGYLNALIAILGFLLISGFSIGKSILRNNETYLKRRIQRIYPVYLASVLFVIVVDGFNMNFNSISFLILNLFFLNHIVVNHSLVGPAWTLALEVWLYCLAPFLLKLTKKTLLIIVGISFTCYMAYTCGRSLLHLNYYSGSNFGINLPALAFMWVAGFILAIFPNAKKNTSFIIALLFIGDFILTVGIQVLFRLKHHNISDLLHIDLKLFIMNGIFAAIVYFLVIRGSIMPSFKPLTNKVFSFLGNISYPLYLTHYTTFELLKKYHLDSTIVLILSALLVSTIIYYVFDSYSKKRAMS